MFARDWLYIYLKSTVGCRVNIITNFKSDQRRPRGAASSGALDGGTASEIILSRQATANKADKDSDLDFANFNLGNGPLNEKKKRLAAYVQNIMNDKKNVKQCNETIRRNRDRR